MPALQIISEENEVTYSNYSGAGPLSFTFAHAEKLDINVDVDGETLAQSEWVHTPVVADGGYDGGTVTLVVPVVNKDVRIWRDMVRLRASQFGVGGATARAIDTEFNRLVLMAQDARNPAGSGLADAPNDGSYYARRNATWTAFTPGSGGGGGGIDEAPNDGSYYARRNEAWESFVPGGASGDDPVVSNYAALKAIAEGDRSAGMTVFVSGRSSASDGGGGWFYFNSASSDTDNGGTILAPDAGTGRWIRIRDFGVYNVRWWGATGDGATDDTTAIQAAVSSIPTTGQYPGGVLYFPRGDYRCTTTITLPDYTTLKGDGHTTTRIDFIGQTSGVGVKTDGVPAAGQSYYCGIEDILIENGFSHNISFSNTTGTRIENVVSLTSRNGDGIYIDGASYMISLENVWIRECAGYGVNVQGFVTSIQIQNVHALENELTGIRINNAVYCKLDTVGSDRSVTGYGYIIRNVSCLVLDACGAETNRKSAIRFEASTAIAGESGVLYPDVYEVFINGFFSYQNAQDTTSPCFIESASLNSRQIDVTLMECIDDNGGSATSIQCSGETRIVRHGGRLDGSISQSGNARVWNMNTRAVPAYGQHFIGDAIDSYINSVLVQRTNGAGTTFRGSTTGAAFFNLITTPTGAGAMGLALKTGDTNSTARDWGLYQGNNTRGDFVIMQSSSQGGNPISGNTAIRITADRDVAVKTSTAYEALTVNGNICPATDNARTNGTASWRWSVVYAGTGTINTSDERDKRDIEDPTEAELRAISRILGDIKKYRWKDAVEEKGDAARIHFGVMAQEVEAAFIAEGLDPRRYGLFCEDLRWNHEKRITGHVPAIDEDGNPILDEEGNPVITEQFEMVKTPVLDENGVQLTRMGVRYDQLYALAMAAIWTKVSGL